MAAGQPSDLLEIEHTMLTYQNSVDTGSRNREITGLAAT